MSFIWYNIISFLRGTDYSVSSAFNYFDYEPISEENEQTEFDEFLIKQLDHCVECGFFHNYGEPRNCPKKTAT